MCVALFIVEFRPACVGASRSPWDDAGSWPRLRAREGHHQLLLLRDGEVDSAWGKG